MSLPPFDEDDRQFHDFEKGLVKALGGLVDVLKSQLDGRKSLEELLAKPLREFSDKTKATENSLGVNKGHSR